MKGYIFLIILFLLSLQGMGQKKTYEYDDLNRLSKAHYWEGSSIKATITYTYDEVGNRLSKLVSVVCNGMYSIVSGNWNTTSTWSCGRTPTISDDVTISAGHTVTIPAGQTGFVNKLTQNGNLSISSLGALKIKTQ